MTNIFPHLKENARIANFGAKISNRRLSWILNGVLRIAFIKLNFPSSPKIEKEPRTILEKRLVKISVEEFFFGWMFLAWGNADNTKDKS